MEKTAEFKEKLDDSADKVAEKVEDVKEDAAEAVENNVDFGKISEEAGELEKKLKTSQVQSGKRDAVCGQFFFL